MFLKLCNQDHDMAEYDQDTLIISNLGFLA